MTNIYSKYLYMLSIIVIALGLFSTGCTNQPKGSAILDTKMDSLSHSVEALEPEINQLNKRLDEQATDIESSLSAQTKAHNSLKKELTEIGAMVEDVKQNMTLIDEERENAKSQLDEVNIRLESQIDELKTQLEGLKTELEKSESAAKDASAEKGLIEELFDDAIKLYRQGNFEDAISKWEELLTRDPSEREAKFYIEIAKDRIKEKQILDELKALLIQRK